jgi:hypothetical protein
VIGLFGVDLPSNEFRLWLESKIERDNERGILEMVTISGKRINCFTPFLERLLEGEVSDWIKIMTGRTPGDAASNRRKHIEDPTRDLKKCTAFPWQIERGSKAE